ALRRPARRLAACRGSLPRARLLLGAGGAPRAARGLGRRLRPLPVALAAGAFLVDPFRRAPPSRARELDRIAAELRGRIRARHGRGPAPAARRCRPCASPWSADDVGGLNAQWVHVGALFRGEFPAETLAALAGAGVRLSFDGQGLVRPARSGPLVLEPEPELSFLRHISVLKLSEEEALAL